MRKPEPTFVGTIIQIQTDDYADIWVRGFDPAAPLGDWLVRVHYDGSPSEFILGGSGEHPSRPIFAAAIDLLMREIA